MAVWGWVSPVHAQHQHGQHHASVNNAPVDSLVGTDEVAHLHGEDGDHVMHENHATMAGILSIHHAMQMDGSGTSWHPAESPMEGLHGEKRNWHYMLHGRTFLQYNNQDVFQAGYRGAQAFGAPTWVMGMATKALSSRGRLSVRAMFTGEPFTEGGDGYPLLFQTGETYKDIPLVDWQHPHDLIAELSITYSHTLGKRSSFYVYGALPGEPAIGPPAFMHRPSARHIPNSPIGHHWQDATHVTFGVGTLGFIYGPIKLDASIFTGREPNEERLGFDKPRFDSYSARASVNLNDNWAFQASRAYITGPEVHAPDIDMWRTAVSLLYGAAQKHGYLSAALVWGLNDPAGDPSAAGHVHVTGRDGAHLHAHTVTQHSFLFEADLNLKHFSFYNRTEYLQKDGAELGVERVQDDLFWVGATTFGSARRLLEKNVFDLLMGSQVTLYRVPDMLQPVYGQSPISAQIYLRFNLK